MPSILFSIPVTNTILTYGDYEGQKLPALMVQKVRGMETHRTVQSVEFNGLFPKNIFDLPPEIKTLLEEEAALDARDMDASPDSEDLEADWPEDSGPTADER